MMFLFGVNFNIYFFILIKDFKSIFKSEELKAYFLRCLVAVAFIFANTWHMFGTVSEALRQSSFHISSIII